MIRKKLNQNKKRSMSPLSKGNHVKYPNSGNTIISMNKKNARGGSRKSKMRSPGGICLH